MAVSVRKYVDCREFPSQNNCSLKISGTEQEVLAAPAQHAVSSTCAATSPCAIAS